MNMTTRTALFVEYHTTNNLTARSCTSASLGLKCACTSASLGLKCALTNSLCTWHTREPCPWGHEGSKHWFHDYQRNVNWRHPAELHLYNTLRYRLVTTTTTPRQHLIQCTWWVISYVWWEAFESYPLPHNEEGRTTENFVGVNTEATENTWVKGSIRT